MISSGFKGSHSTTINGHGNPDNDKLIDAGVKAGLKEKECKRIYLETKEATLNLVSFIQKRFHKKRNES